jgi:hypothetical protein
MKWKNMAVVISPLDVFNEHFDDRVLSSSFPQWSGYGVIMATILSRSLPMTLFLMGLSERYSLQKYSAHN